MPPCLKGMVTSDSLLGGGDLNIWAFYLLFTVAFLSRVGQRPGTSGDQARLSPLKIQGKKTPQPPTFLLTTRVSLIWWWWSVALVWKKPFWNSYLIPASLPEWNPPDFLKILSLPASFGVIDFGLSCGRDIFFTVLVLCLSPPSHPFPILASSVYTLLLGASRFLMVCHEKSAIRNEQCSRNQNRRNGF